MPVRFLYCCCKRFGYYVMLDWENALRDILLGLTAEQMNAFRANLIHWQIRLARGHMTVPKLWRLLGLIHPDDDPEPKSMQKRKGASLCKTMPTAVRICGYCSSSGLFCEQPPESPSWALCFPHRMASVAPPRPLCEAPECHDGDAIRIYDSWRERYCVIS